MSARLDVRRMLLRRGWESGTSWTLLRKGDAAASINGADVFLSGPARRGRGRCTATFPYDIPATVVVAACEAWAAAASPTETETPQ